MPTTHRDKEPPRVSPLALDDVETTLSDRATRHVKRLMAAFLSPTGLTVLLGALTFLSLSFILGFDYLAVEKPWTAA